MGPVATSRPLPLQLLQLPARDAVLLGHVVQRVLVDEVVEQQRHKEAAVPHCPPVCALPWRWPRLAAKEITWKREDDGYGWPVVYT